MIYQKIVKVMEEIIPLGRIKRDDIVPTIQPLLSKYKMVIKPSEVIDFRYMNQEASFIMKYELVDTEDNELKSIITQIPGGGFDQEKKGRATYMALTGAYRQAIQQIFAIPIEDETSQLSNDGFNADNNEQDGFSSLDEFQNAETSTETNTENIQNNQTPQAKSLDEITEADIDSEFANF